MAYIILIFKLKLKNIMIIITHGEQKIYLL